MKSLRLSTATIRSEESVRQGILEMSDKLTKFQNEVYDLIEGRGAFVDRHPDWRPQ